jgi:hypothetical protein
MSKKRLPPNYERQQGSSPAIGPKKKSISFSWVKLSPDQGQSIEEWENLKLLSTLTKRLQQIGQYESSAALAQQMIKQYTQVGFPPNSKFLEPKFVKPKIWAVIHITPNSKAVVAGFIEDEVFYLVFLDKDHEFWPTDIQNRNKVIR